MTADAGKKLGKRGSKKKPQKRYPRATTIGNNAPVDLSADPVISGAIRRRLDEVIDDPDRQINLADIYYGPNRLPNELAERVRVINNHCSEYTWPFIKSALRYMLYSGLPRDQIAQKFNVSVFTIYDWTSRLEKERDEALFEFSVRSKISEILDRKQMLIEQSLQQAALAKSPRDKLAFMRMAAQLDNEIATVINMAGGFSDAPLSEASIKSAQGEVQEDRKGAGRVVALLENFLSAEGDHGIIPDTPEAEYEVGGETDREVEREVECEVEGEVEWEDVHPVAPPPDAQPDTQPDDRAKVRDQGTYGSVRVRARPRRNPTRR